MGSDPLGRGQVMSFSEFCKKAPVPEVNMICDVCAEKEIEAEDREYARGPPKREASTPIDVVQHAVQVALQFLELLRREAAQQSVGHARQAEWNLAA